jgi:hypothetical protein
MAAKTVTESDPTFAAALAQVQPALAAWRERRKHREPIPDALWRRMVPLARRYGLSPVARVLRVNYTGLKRHVVARFPSPGGGTGPGAPPFVEVPVGAWPSASPWVIELEDPHGAKLTLRLGPCDGGAALALAQGLWRQRA